jgi:hypothetical protein
MTRIQPDREQSQRPRRSCHTPAVWLTLLALVAAACSDDPAGPSPEADLVSPAPTDDSTEDSADESVDLDADHDGLFVMFDSTARSSLIAANLAAPDEDVADVGTKDGLSIGNLRLPETIQTGRLLTPSSGDGRFLYVTRSPLDDDGVAGGGWFVIEVDGNEPTNFEQIARVPFDIDLLLADPDRPGDLFGRGSEGCFRVGAQDPEPLVLLPDDQCIFLSAGYAALVAGDPRASLVQLSTLDGDVSEFELPDGFDVNDLGVNPTGDLLYVIGDEGTARTGAVLFYDIASGEQVTRTPEEMNGVWEVLSDSSEGELLVNRKQVGPTAIYRAGEEPTTLDTPPNSQTRAAWLAPDGSVALLLLKIGLDAQTDQVRLDAYGPDGQQVATLFEQDFPGASLSNAAGADLWVVGEASNATVAVQFVGDPDRRELFIGDLNAPLEPVGLDGREVIRVVGDDATGDLAVLINKSQSPGIDRFAVVFAGGDGQDVVVDEREGEYPFGPPFVLDLADGEVVVALVDDGRAAAYSVAASGPTEIGDAEGYEKAINRSPEDVFFLDTDGDVVLTHTTGTFVCRRNGCGEFSGPIGRTVRWSEPPSGRTARQLSVG